MKMTEGVEWAVHCCSLLAGLQEHETLAGGALAEFFGLPRPYLLKHLRALTRANILRASSGPRGGYALARPADKVTLLDIVRAVEGTERAFRCTEIRQRGPSALNPSHYPAPCGIAAVMWRAEEAWERVLSDTTVSDIARLGTRTVPAKQRALAHDWLAHAVR